MSSWICSHYGRWVVLSALDLHSWATISTWILLSMTEEASKLHCNLFYWSQFHLKVSYQQYFHLAVEMSWHPRLISPCHFRIILSISYRCSREWASIDSTRQMGIGSLATLLSLIKGRLSLNKCALKIDHAWKRARVGRGNVPWYVAGISLISMQIASHVKS